VPGEGTGVSAERIDSLFTNQRRTVEQSSAGSVPGARWLRVVNAPACTKGGYMPLRLKMSDRDRPDWPVCPACGVPLWLAKIVIHPTGRPTQDRYFYQCKACDPPAALEPLDD